MEATINPVMRGSIVVQANSLDEAMQKAAEAIREKIAASGMTHTHEGPRMPGYFTVPSEMEQMGKALGSLVNDRQKAYGEAYPKVSKILKILYGDEIPAKKMADIPYVTRIIEKICRTTTEDPDGEDPRKDLAGTALLWWHDYPLDDDEDDEDY